MTNAFGGLRKENYFNSLQDENQINEYRTVYNQQRLNGFNSDEAMDIAQQHVMKMTKAPAQAAPSVNIQQKQVMVDPYPGFKLPITGQKIQWLFSGNQQEKSRLDALKTDGQKLLSQPQRSKPD